MRLSSKSKNWNLFGQNASNWPSFRKFILPISSTCSNTTIDWRRLVMKIRKPSKPWKGSLPPFTNTTKVLPRTMKLWDRNLTKFFRNQLPSVKNWRRVPKKIKNLSTRWRKKTTKSKTWKLKSPKTKRTYNSVKTKFSCLKRKLKTEQTK
mgnify:CR=1 FL=1